MLPYLDCCGKWWKLCTCVERGNLTIGHGRNLDALGVSSDEALYLLDNDISEALNDLLGFKWFVLLNEARQVAVLSLRFNLGPEGFREFDTTIGFLEAGDPVGAAAHFRTNVRYFRQTGRRAEWIADVLETGVINV